MGQNMVDRMQPFKMRLEILLAIWVSNLSWTLLLFVSQSDHKIIVQQIVHIISN